MQNERAMGGHPDDDKAKVRGNGRSFEAACELANLLTVVIGNIELAEKLVQDPKARYRLKLGRAAAESAAAVIIGLMADPPPKPFS